MEELQKLVDRYLNDSTHYPVNVPDGECDGWRVATRTITETEVDVANLRQIFKGTYECIISAGSYKVLITPDNEVMMSNTQLEYRTNKDFVAAANGDVLVTGLGLGMLIRPLLDNPNVTSLTIIEKEAAVIQLVAPYYADLQDKLTIIECDAFEYVPDREYDCVYHDIWPNINGNESEMAELETRFDDCTGDQYFWCKGYEASLIRRWQAIGSMVAGTVYRGDDQ